MLETFSGRAMETLGAARDAALDHTLVLLPSVQTSVAQLLRLVEQANFTSDRTVVIHPPLNTPIDRDRRWTTLIEHAVNLNPDSRLVVQLPPPTGLR